MVKSIIDLDLYELSMSYCFAKLYPDSWGTMTFFDRNNTEYTEEFVEDLRREFYSLKNIFLSEDEFKWCCKKIKYIPEVYWEFLSGWRFDPEKIEMHLDENKHLHIEVTDKMYRVILYEIAILSTLSELIHRKDSPIDLKETYIRLNEKIGLSNRESLKFSDMCTRRRFSYDIQDKVLERIKESSNYCVGTSNVHFAMKYDMTPIGTVSHLFYQFHAAMFGYRMGNYEALEAWLKCFDGYYGTCLTDTFTSKVFFDNFSRKHALLSSGVRCDSGDEFKYVGMAIARYKELDIDPKSKYIVFSNALDFKKALEIKEYCQGRIGCSFGIGTNLGCDIPGVKPANIVMKLTKCRMNENKSWIPCIKISDDLGKHMGNQEELDLAARTLGITLEK